MGCINLPSRCKIRIAPYQKLALTNVPPKAIAAAKPEQKTNISVASYQPNRAGM